MSNEETGEWIVIRTLVRGFKHKDTEWFADIEYNPTTKMLRACSDPKQRVLHQHHGSFDTDAMCGAPTYLLVYGDKTMIVLLGETYSVEAR